MQELIGTAMTVIKTVFLVVIFIVFALSVRSLTKPTPFSASNQLTALIVNVAALAAYVIIMGVTVKATLALAIMVIGGVVGFFIGNVSKLYEKDGIVMLKRNLLTPLLQMLAYLVSLSFVLFGTKTLMSFGLLLVAGAATMDCASIISELFRGSRFGKKEAVPQI